MLNKCVAIDIETSGLLEDMLDYSSFPYKLKEDAKIWVISFTDVSTMSTSSLVLDQITKESINEKLAPYDYILQHNGIKFDLLTLQLFGLIDYKIGWLTEEDTLNGRKVRFIDTLILSRLLNPTRFGGHSLKSWGERVGDYKDDYRGKCVEAGIIDAKAPKGEEFKQFNRFMTPYCEQDTIVTAKTFLKLLPEYTSHQGWKMPFKMESKLADLAIRREHLGFWFDKDLAIKCVEDLTQKMEELRSKVNPILPPKPMTKTELSFFTPPATQFLKSGKPSTHIIKFAERIGGRIVENEEQEYFIEFENNLFKLPYNEPLKTHTEADISNLDHVKMTLISKGWNPSDWRERDFTKDSKKLSLPMDKRVTAFKRWVKETVDDGKYKKHRLEIAFENYKVKTVEALEEVVLEKLKDDFPVRLPTSPNVRVGVEKELCPELIKLGDKVEFAKDFALYLTYKHRKSSIAGGDIEDMDFDEESPSTGYLSVYREIDGRVPTPAIEIGANTSRYKHVSVANIPRATSEYGKEMRSLFGCGKEAVQLGFDYASLEARIQGHYCWNGTDGKELSKTLLAEKPFDVHCYSEDTEILTKKGWKRFGMLTLKDEVAQYWKDSQYIDYTTPTDIVWQDYKGEMIRFKSQSVDLLVTPNHRMLVLNEDNRSKQQVFEARDFSKRSFASKRFLTSAIKHEGVNENKTFIKLLVATQADGTFSKDCSAIVFNFKRKNKAENLLSILQELKVNYSYKEYTTEKRGLEFLIRLNASDFTAQIREILPNKHFSDIFLTYDLETRLTFLQELGKWDGTIKKNGDIVFDTTDFISADLVQAVACISGIKSISNDYEKNTTFGKTLIRRVYLSNSQKPYASVKNTYSKIENYVGKIGCVSVPSSLVVVRRNGRVMISGNTITGQKLGIPRSDAKSVNYMLMYGGSWVKAKKMLNLSDKEAKEIVNKFWESMPALKELKESLEIQWKQNGERFIYAIDGRKLWVRSKHSIINLLFQSGGVICAKYVTVMMMEKLEKAAYCIDPFLGKPDVCSMIEYHDEAQLYCNPKFFKYERFSTEDEAKEFVKNWKGEGQLSDISFGKSWYITYPNVVTKVLEDSIRDMEKLLKLNVPLGYAFSVSNTWYGCH